MSASPSSRFGIAANVVLQVVLAVLICVGVNVLSYRYYVRADLSDNATYSLSSSTIAFLQKLPKDVEITGVFARGAARYDDVRALTDEYRRNGAGRVKVMSVDPTRDLERTEQMKVENALQLDQQGILVKAGGASRFIKEAELVVQTPGIDKDHPMIEFRGEDALTSAIIGLMEGAKRKFYFISGKGARAEASESEVFAALQDIGRQQSFDVAPLFMGEVNAIPEDASGLILIGARYDLAERELGMLRDYWGRRRASILVLLDPAGETPRLDSFLRANGIAPRNDRVLFAESTSAGPRKVFGVEAYFAKEPPPTRAVRDAAAHLAGQTQSLALALDNAALREQSITVSPLAAASPRYWGESSYLDDLPVPGGEHDTAPPIFVAASAERGAVDDERLRVDSARLVVVGNPTLLDRATRLAVNQDFLIGSLNWMLNRERLIGITPKSKRQYRIQLTDTQRTLLFAITTFCAPALVLMFGVTIWARRRAS